MSRQKSMPIVKTDMVLTCIDGSSYYLLASVLHGSYFYSIFKEKLWLKGFKYTMWCIHVVYIRTESNYRDTMYQLVMNINALV